MASGGIFRRTLGLLVMEQTLYMGRTLQVQYHLLGLVTGVLSFLPFKSLNSCNSKLITRGIVVASQVLKIFRSHCTHSISDNDLVFGFLNTTEDQVKLTFPDILYQFSQAVQRRANWLRSRCGCDPVVAALFPPKNATHDKNHCAVAQNEVVQEFNMQLKDTVVQLRKQLPQAAITYVDVYKKSRFEDSWNFCCGILEPNLVLFCGTRSDDNNNTSVATACADPSEPISWDGIHFSEAANQWVLKRMFDGSVSHTPVPLNQACAWTKKA
ncbi:Alpha-L-fucosidase 2 precursor, putative [Ricinus communis]|uniref:Alpha-L-fucosidase 2, putative n=1 Tax=Ricinus communis TaxID=3988 RepID=B9RUS6_RICCO|nr:Alpha-L-fucosidase 2 precursor, putative [Ricinus communis]